MDYMTKEEAEKKVAQLNVPVIQNQLCPLLNNLCTSFCVCWAKATVRKNPDIKSEANYYIQEGYCSNAMFFGSN